MAKFLIGRPLRKAAVNSGWLRSFLWRIDYMIISVILWLFRLPSVEQASRMGHYFGRLVGPKLEKNRHVLRNLEIAFPQLAAPERDRLGREIWANAGSVMAEYTQLDRICGDQFDQFVEIECAGEIRAFGEPGTPAVLVTAHIGNWELVAAATVRQGAKLTSLYSPPANPLINARLMRERLAMGSEMLSRDANTRDLVRVLQQGRVLGVVMDRRVDNGEPVPFFGHDKRTTLVPARLAVKFGCELIPARIQRLDGARFRVTFCRPIKPRIEQGTELEKAVDMTEQINEAFAEWIRLAPQEWLCTKRLWDKELEITLNTPTKTDLVTGH